MIGANGIVRGEKVTSLARWPPNPDAGPFLWRTIGSGGLPVLPDVNLILEDYCLLPAVTLGILWLMLGAYWVDSTAESY